MKSILLILFTFFLGLNLCFAQIQPKKGESAKANMEISAKGLSPQTAFLLMDIKKIESEGRKTSINDITLFEKYSLFEKYGEVFVNAFLIVSEKLDLNELYKERVEISSQSGNILTAIIPVYAIEQISNIKGIEMVQIGEKAKTVMDNAKNSTWVNWVHQGYQLPQSYYGNGVVVGIIDIGFDYTHPNFYDTTGANNYRIKRVWEQEATTGTPPSGFSYGRELSNQNTILNAQRDRINESHGTHVAGIAAGAGGGVDTTFMGVAPQSELVLVSTTMQTVGIADGIAYIINYANSVNKPCVINISIGGHIGPHDGSSLFDQYCDGIVGQGKILVGAAGNEGSTPLYIGNSYTSSDDTLYSFIEFPYSSNGTNGQTIIDIWGNPNQNYEVAVNIFNTNTNQFEDWTPYVQANSNNTYSYTLYDNDIFFPDACEVMIATNTYNNKRNVQVYIDHTAQDDNYRWAMIEIKATNGQTKMWASGSHFTSNGYNHPIIDGSTASTMGEIGGTGNNIISVGAYTSKNSWTAINGSSQTADSYASIGAIAPFSSKGPTADNRTKPDITAPGNILASSVSRFDSNYVNSGNRTVSGVTNGTNTWLFGMMEGTSMASPMVTGILALWLEANPNLTPTQIKQLLKDNAWTDSFTGNIPSNGNNTWGWGKIDAHEGLLSVLSNLSNEDYLSNNESIKIYPNPTNGKLNISFYNNQNNIKFELYDIRGKLVKRHYSTSISTNNIEIIDLDNVSNGVYILHISSDKLQTTHKVVKY